jgi:hypothetical protein
MYFDHSLMFISLYIVDVNDRQQPPKKKSRTYKPKVVEIIETAYDASKKKRKASSKGKQPSKKKKTTPAEPTPPEQSVQ